MIKCSTRRNLKYPSLLLLFNTLRDIDINLILLFFDINYISFYILLMFVGQLLAGLIYYFKENKFLSKNNKNSTIKFINIGYYKPKNNLPKDKILKRIFLIFVCSFHDFVQILVSISLLNYVKKSIIFERRFRRFLTIYTALLSYFMLRLNIYKHHILSIFVILFCLIILGIMESIFFQNTENFPPIYSLFIYFILSFAHICFAFKHIIEKYLFEYNESNPYLILILEGIFGIIITTIYFIIYSPFNIIIRFYKLKSTGEFIILMIGFILLLILSGAVCLFRVLTTKIFNPIITTLIDYILNPLYIIIIFSIRGDFANNGKIFWIYFVFNLIVSFIITFFGLVYNEIFILFCYGLDKETHKQITERSILDSNISDLYEDTDNENNINLEGDKSPYIIKLEEENKTKVSEFSE